MNRCERAYSLMHKYGRDAVERLLSDRVVLPHDYTKSYLTFANEVDRIVQVACAPTPDTIVLSDLGTSIAVSVLGRNGHSCVTTAQVGPDSSKERALSEALNANPAMVRLLVDTASLWDKPQVVAKHRSLPRFVDELSVDALVALLNDPIAQSKAVWRMEPPAKPVEILRMTKMDRQRRLAERDKKKGN